ncbi:MAG: hypothetical protein Q9191_002576 [Dirinaria sp. TL-2023a]
MASSSDIPAKLSKAIITDDENHRYGLILDRLINGAIPARVAASDILDNLALEDDLGDATYALSCHLQNLALEYPFLLPHWSSLMSSVLDLPSSAHQKNFLNTFNCNLVDLSDYLYATVFGDDRPDGKNVLHHEHVNGLHASLFAVQQKHTEADSVIVCETSALFILSVGLEDHVNSHHNVELDTGPASQWISHAGEAIYGLCKAGTEQPATASMAARGSGWSGPLGYSLERWAFWRDRFESIGNELLGTRTGKAAANAARAMKAIESAIV